MRRVYTGWKAGLTVVALVVVVFSVLNVLINARRDDTPRNPPKVVTSITSRSS